MTKIELDEHRRIHAPLPAQGFRVVELERAFAAQAILTVIPRDDAWASLPNFARRVPSFADGVALNKTGAHC